MKSASFWFVGSVLAAVLVAVLAPLERTLGSNARLVYFHGAWVWAALFSFLAAAGAGLAGLLLQNTGWHRWSQAFGRSALVFWVTFLPMSLLVMQANWNGLFLDEPRFRIPLNLAVVAVLLQIGLVFFPLVWTSIANLVYGLILFLIMRSTDTVLHPDSPVFSAEAGDIRVFFIVLVLLLAFSAWQMARLWHIWETGRSEQARLPRPVA